MQHNNWQCTKCSNTTFETDQFRATGGMFPKIFDVQNKRFTTVTCDRCTFIEIYRTKSSALGHVLDFFTQ
jgi:predicted nucleic-acid-binding Zn-ribbon protein